MNDLVLYTVLFFGVFFSMLYGIYANVNPQHNIFRKKGKPAILHTKYCEPRRVEILEEYLTLDGMIYCKILDLERGTFYTILKSNLILVQEGEK